MWWWRCCLWLFDDLTLAISVNRPQQQQWTVHFYLFRVPHIKTGVPQIYLLFHKDSLHTYFDKVAALLSTTMSSYSNSKYLTLSLPVPQLFSLDKTNRQNCFTFLGGGAWRWGTQKVVKKISFHHRRRSSHSILVGLACVWARRALFYAGYGMGAAARALSLKCNPHAAY